MSIRTITKALAGAQDLLLGSEQRQQERGSSTVTLDGLSAQNLPYKEEAGRTIAEVLRVGAGSPEGVVEAIPGTLYLNTNGGTGTTLYVKETGSDATGWVAK